MSLQHKALLGLRSGNAPSRALQPDRTRRPGWDVSDPPFRPPGAARKGSPLSSPMSRAAGRSLTSGVDPCGKAPTG